MALVNELKPLVANDEADVVFCVPAIDIIPAMEAAKGTNIQIGAENMYYEEKVPIPARSPEYAYRCRGKICDYRPL